MRREYELTKEQHEAIISASQPVPYLVMGGIPPRSPQENANAAWERLGRELGFDHMSVRPLLDKGEAFFTANATGAGEEPGDG